MGDAEKEKESMMDKQTTDDNDTSSISTSTGSASNETSRKRVSLGLLHPGPGTSMSPPPEALPAFQRPPVSQSNVSQTSIQRQLSGRRPETSKSVKSGKSETSRTESVKKRLSFMNISKKSSKSSVRGRAHDTLIEE
jgi:dedicator of cytokinesis protein 3